MAGQQAIIHDKEGGFHEEASDLWSYVRPCSYGAS